MLTLDQVRLLENKVGQAVERIQALTKENQSLQAHLEASYKRVSELEALVTSFKEDQGRIEEGILSALSRLSAFEDAVLSKEKPESLISDSGTTVTAGTTVQESVTEQITPVKASEQSTEVATTADLGLDFNTSESLNESLVSSELKDQLDEDTLFGNESDELQNQTDKDSESSNTSLEMPEIF